MLLGAGSLILAACNDFLDELPDNRTELDTPDKINRLLVSAYPSRSFTRMCEIDLLGIADRLSVFIRKPHQISSSLTVCTYRIFLVEIQ